MLALLFASAALASGLPTAEITWKGDTGRLTVHGPAGEHVAPDATAAGTLSWADRVVDFAGPGQVLIDGLPLAAVQGASLEGTLKVSICQDGGTLCRLVDVSVSGQVPELKKGTLSLVVTPPQQQQAHAADPFGENAEQAAAAAFALAAERGVPVLIDFTAVWCPPCNLLAAELLHDPDQAVYLEPFVLLQVDVDDPTSWALKDRYAVRGYPTVVVTDADGTELDRLEGYPGLEETQDFLLAIDSEPAPPSPVEQAVADAADAEAAVAALNALTDLQETKELRLERIGLAANLDDARWLVANAPASAIDWAYGARSLAETEEGKAVLVEATQAALLTAGPADASDLLYVLSLIDEPNAKAWCAAAASSLHSAFTGNPDRDRGYYTWYAHLLHNAGGTDAAIAFLDKAQATYPDEPTWTLTAAGLLLDADRPQQALERIDRDQHLSWGDNRLRLARQKIDALLALDRAEEAKAFATETLEAVPEPTEGLDVRTSKYRAKVAEVLSDGVGEAE